MWQGVTVNARRSATSRSAHHDDDHPPARGRPVARDTGLSDIEHIAGVLLDRARAAIDEQDTPLAREVLRQARSALNDAAGPGSSVVFERQLLRLRLTETWILFEDSGLPGVVDVIAQIHHDCLATGHVDIGALCDMQQAALYGRGGALDKALDSMQRAESGRHLLTDAEQARLLINRGSLSAIFGDPAEASQDLAEAAMFAEQAGLEAVTFKAIHNQGHAEFLMGNFPAALALMERADAMDVEVDRGIARLDRARVMLEAGLIDEAHQMLLTALEHAADTGSEHDRGEIELDLARCEILIGATTSAHDHAAAARRRFRRRGESGWRRIAQLTELESGGQAAASARSRERLARALGQAAAGEGDTTTRQRANLLLAEALVDQGRHVEARDTLKQAQSLLRSPHLATRLHTRHVSARISAEGGRHHSAVRILRRAAEDLAAAGRQSAGLDLRTALTVHATELIGLDLDLAMRGGSATRVLARTELWRDVIRTLPPVRTSEDPARASAISRVRRAREELRQAPPETSSASLRLEVTRAERAARELDWTTEVDAPQVTPDLGPMTTPEIQDAVRSAGVSMLSTFIRGPEWYAVLVRPDGGASLHRLGLLSAITDRVRAAQADLNAAARVHEDHPMYAVVRASLTQRLIELEDALLSPLLDEGLGASPLVVVPTPVLSLVPWGMLPSRRGRATTVARSATMWARRHTQVEFAPTICAVAGPDVPLADDEVAAVIDVWGAGRSVVAARSTTTDLLTAFGDSDVVHVAAHGEHHAQNPLFSSLRLGDGSLFAHEIEGRRMRASQVVLSACESGRISVRRGEEALGMTASLLSMGVPTVIAAGSPVPDSVAHAVMSTYHQHLAEGMDAATALAAATAEGDVLAASFTCFGSTWRYSPTGT